MRKNIILGLSSYASNLKGCLYADNRYFSFSVNTLNHEDFLFKKVSELLKKNNLKFKDITAVCNVNAPGRFTGLRISYTFATILNSIARIKLYGVSVFDILAYNVFISNGNDKDIMVLLHCFKDEFYLARYKIKRNKLYKVSKPVWLYKEEVLTRIKKFKGLVVADVEEYPDIYKIFPVAEKADVNISRVIPENIIKASLYFNSTDIKPLYLKPAKFIFTR